MATQSVLANWYYIYYVIRTQHLLQQTSTTINLTVNKYVIQLTVNTQCRFITQRYDVYFTRRDTPNTSSITNKKHNSYFKHSRIPMQYKHQCTKAIIYQTYPTMNLNSGTSLLNYLCKQNTAKYINLKITKRYPFSTWLS